MVVRRFWRFRFRFYANRPHRHFHVGFDFEHRLFEVWVGWFGAAVVYEDPVRELPSHEIAGFLADRASRRLLVRLVRACLEVSPSRPLSCRPFRPDRLGRVGSAVLLEAAAANPKLPRRWVRRLAGVAPVGTAAVLAGRADLPSDVVVRLCERWLGSSSGEVVLVRLLSSPGLPPALAAAICDRGLVNKASLRRPLVELASRPGLSSDLAEHLGRLCVVPEVLAALVRHQELCRASLFRLASLDFPEVRGLVLRRAEAVGDSALVLACRLAASGHGRFDPVGLVETVASVVDFDCDALDLQLLDASLQLPVRRRLVEVSSPGRRLLAA